MFMMFLFCMSADAFFIHIRHPPVEIPSAALSSQLCALLSPLIKQFTSSSHFAVRGDGCLTDTGSEQRFRPSG